MIPRWCLPTFVFALPVLAISFGAVLGTSQLMGALGDADGSYVMRWVAIICLVLLLVDALCLLTLLGVRALDEPTDRE